MKGEREEVLIVQKVRATTIYKLLLYGLLISLIPLGVLFGITGFFGSDTVKWNNRPIHGFAALLAGPAISAMVAVFFTVFIGTVVSLGLWVLSWVRPIKIRVVPQDAAAGDNRPAAGADRA